MRFATGLFAACALFATVATADDLPHDWAVFENDKSCEIQKTFQDTAKVTLSLSKEEGDNVYLFFISDQWSPVNGANYPISMLIGQEFFGGIGEAEKERLKPGVFGMKVNQKFVTALAKGDRIFVQIDRVNSLYQSLIGSSSAVSALNACMVTVKERLDYEAAQEKWDAERRAVMPPNPFEKAKPIPAPK